MSVFKRLFARLRGKNKKGKQSADKGEAWYNNAHEKKRSRWHTPVDGGYYDGAHFDQAVTNQIAKR